MTITAGFIPRPANKTDDARKVRMTAVASGNLDPDPWCPEIGRIRVAAGNAGLVEQEPPSQEFVLGILSRRAYSGLPCLRYPPTVGPCPLCGAKSPGKYTVDCQNAVTQTFKRASCNILGPLAVFVSRATKTSQSHGPGLYEPASARESARIGDSTHGLQIDRRSPRKASEPIASIAGRAHEPD